MSQVTSSSNRRSNNFWVWFIGFGIFIALGILAYFTFTNYIDIQTTIDMIEFDISEIEQLDTPADAPLEALLLERVEMTLAEAEAAVDLAFNLLGIFEALSLAITVGGVVLTAFGLTRFTNARNELEETRKLLEEELENARKNLNTAINQSETQLTDLRHHLEVAANNDRQKTQDALLANALIPIAERQYKTADHKGALDSYHRALALDPESPVINQRLGYVYTQTGDLEKAKMHYEAAIERIEDFAPALAGLGFVYRRFAEQAGKVDFETMTDDTRTKAIIERDRLHNKAEELLLKALDLSPKLVDDDGESYWGILGGLYKRRGQIDQAIEAYQKVVDFTPQSSYGYVNLALLYQQKNNRPKALETYAKVENIASKEAEAEAGNFWGYADLISSSYAIGKSEQAEEALPIAISIAPIDSPYMLTSLKGTLLDLIDFLEDEKLPPIHRAVEIIDQAIENREAQQR